MKLNKFIFPAPNSSYSANQLLGELIYIPRIEYKPKSDCKRKKSDFSGSVPLSKIAVET